MGARAGRDPLHGGDRPHEGGPGGSGRGSIQRHKIGTYALAVLADHHGIPFYVAAPRSTFDPELPSGAEIPIEERDPSEVRGVAGRETASPDAGVWNPAFDVTPAHLVTAFLTDGGVLRPPYEITITDLLAS